MNKQDICHKEQLTLYHYAELSPTQRCAFETHLQGCPACRTALEEIQSSLADVHATELKLDSAQKQRFVEKVTSSTRRRPLSNPRIWGGGLAAVGMLALVIVSLYSVDQTVQIVPARPAMADFEVLEQLDMLQELDLLQKLELLQELDKLG